MRGTRKAVFIHGDKRGPSFDFDAGVLRLLTVALSLALAPGVSAQQSPFGSGAPLADDIVARWNFHAGPAGEVLEEKSGKRVRVTGSVYSVRGPTGDALEFDGYTGALHAERLNALSHAVTTTIVCWLQLEAYPWNELPILDQPDTVQDRGGGFLFGLDAEGHLLARLGSGESAVNARSEAAVPLKTWALVTLTIDPARRLDFTIDSQASPSQAVSAAVGHDANTKGSAETQEELLIGHVRRPLLPGPAAMIHPQLPIEYSLEGSSEVWLSTIECFRVTT